VSGLNIEATVKEFNMQDTTRKFITSLPLFPKLVMTMTSLDRFGAPCLFKVYHSHF
jgi:hypothetical protein